MTTFRMLFFTFFLFFLSCGIDNIIILTSPTVIPNNISSNSFYFLLPVGYFSLPNSTRLKGFDIYYKFYPEGFNYYLGGDFNKAVERDYEALKTRFNDNSAFNRRGFYKINLDSNNSSGKPILKVDSSWVTNSLSLKFEVNFENLRNPSNPGSAFIKITDYATGGTLQTYTSIYRAYKPSTDYIEFKDALFLNNVRDSSTRPGDLSHIPDSFFLEPNPRYNLVIFVMAVGDIIDDVYSILVNLGNISAIDLIP